MRRVLDRLRWWSRNARARCVVCYDERSAGYYALGYARAANKPAAVITTSGTAVANLLPAVTEAHTDHVPMLLLTLAGLYAGIIRWAVPVKIILPRRY
ncbi:MAG: thiamine pyrophosphate-binding protein [Planctomycetota bacterium]